MEYRTYGRWQPSIRDVVFSSPHRRYYDDPSAGSSTTNQMQKKNLTLGIVKCLLGLCALLLGLLGLVFEVTLSTIGSGIWAGTIILISGICATMSSRLPKSFSLTVTFLVTCSVSTAASGLLIIFSATGLTKDLAKQSNSDPWSKSPAVNSALVAVGIVDALLSMVCIAMVGGDACSCDSRRRKRRRAPFVIAPPPRGRGHWPLEHHAVAGGGGGGGTRVDGGSGVQMETGIVGKDRLLSWVDQQRVHFWMAQGNVSGTNRMDAVEPCPGCSSASRDLSSGCPSCRSRDTARTTLASTLVDGTSMARAQDFIVRSLSVPCYP